MSPAFSHENIYFRIEMLPVLIPNNLIELPTEIGGSSDITSRQTINLFVRRSVSPS
jgi:hypothetical protein